MPVAVDERPGRVTLFGGQALEDEGGVGRMQAVELCFEFGDVLARRLRELGIQLVGLLERRELARELLLALHQRLDFAQRRFKGRVVFGRFLHGARA